MQTILVVDDAPEMLQQLSELLAPYARVLVARSGHKALEIARTTALDLILLDVVMPEMDGFEVLERLRAMSRSASASTPVMFVTSLDSGEDEERCLERGAVDYVSKPIKPSVVVARVQTQLELRRARASMLQNNRVLEVEIAARMRQSNLVRSATIRAFAHLAETRDNDSGNHLRRTQEYVRVIVDELSADERFAHELTSERRALIVESAPLHDIGKVGVPDHVLRKPGKLTGEEFEIMKTHAAIGANALEHAAKQSDPPVDFLFVASQIARSHHEWWDGTGYPDQLAGAQIPLAARVMAIADVFDALTTARVYQPARSVARAREIIVAGSATHFDPAVVAAFEARFDDMLDVLRALDDGANDSNAIAHPPNP
ncbi:MAG: response regulator [Polyangiales bacterium]